MVYIGKISRDHITTGVHINGAILALLNPIIYFRCYILKFDIFLEKQGT